MNATVIEGYKIYLKARELAIKMEHERQENQKKAAEAAAANETFVLGLMGIAMSLLIFVVLSWIWEYIKSWRVGPITDTPIVPFYSSSMSKRDHPNKYIRFFCGPIGSEHRSNTESLRASLMSLLKIKKEADFPSDARVISVKLDGFDFGSSCQSFEPMDGIGPGSYFTYQMFGDNRIQVTNYVENEVSYVAGFAIYMKDGFISATTICYRFAVIKKLMKSPKYKCTRPITQRIENRVTPAETETTTLLDDFETEDWSVKRCGKLRRDVMTTVSDGSVYHKEWNVNLLKMKIDKCDVCSEDLDQDPLPPSYSSLSMA